jgi:hypothetical protein
MKTVDVQVSVKVAGKTEPIKRTVQAAILGESMADFTALAKEYGSDAVKDEKGSILVPSEKDNLIQFLASSVRRDIEYGRGFRNGIRNQILEEVEGPSKTIDKTVKLLMASGFTEELARTTVLNQRKAKGLPV